MSTKIYTGFRFTTNSWTTVHRHLMAFRSELGEVVRVDLAKRRAEEACLFIDRRALGLDNQEKESPYVRAARGDIDEERRDPPTFDVAVFPYGRRLYGMTFGLPMHENLWHSKPFVEPWGYWNNTDRPDDVTAAEWRRRRDVWDKILSNGSPAMSGFLAKCIDRYGAWIGAEDILPHIPKLDARVRIVAADAMFPVFREKHGGEALSCFMAFRRWIVEGDGREPFAAECEHIRPLLARRITVKMLADLEDRRLAHA